MNNFFLVLMAFAMLACSKEKKEETLTDNSKNQSVEEINYVGDSAQIYRVFSNTIWRLDTEDFQPKQKDLLGRITFQFLADGIFIAHIPLPDNLEETKKVEGTWKLMQANTVIERIAENKTEASRIIVLNDQYMILDNGKAQQKFLPKQ